MDGAHTFVGTPSSLSGISEVLECIISIGYKWAAVYGHLAGAVLVFKPMSPHQ